jgi:pyridoxal biosynthesis lyase PdxS
VALIRVCDMHDLDEWWVVVEATRTFEIDGQAYEIDLCGEHDAALTEALRPYVEGSRARRANGQVGRRSSR